ncbi:hypothetical protein PANT_14c00075 [Moesziomyces antarcticus T-34]|uniref:Uncharacterized protein n=1 Tax=Pseudozyma antarctica (strain T-34) TaxID=1151754 RepID=M9LQY6_PSEA3|nr:hypothetical protein PANT_14c00075 [Moesziomyces antarcticus T-34]
MSTTPSPSKRARLPTSNIPSATASPFAGSSAARFTGPRSVGPTGTSAVGMGMSPSDAFTPGDGYGMSGLTPFSTTSPAYAAGAAGSPLSTALAHGSRVLSGIQAGSPFQNQYTVGPTPMIPQMQYSRYPSQQGGPWNAQYAYPGIMQQPVPAVKPQAPQHGSPEYLKMSLHHLTATLLPKLEAEEQAYFDAVDASLAVTADTRTVAQKAAAFQAALDAVLTYLDEKGLASIPLLPPASSTDPDPASASDAPTDAPSEPTASSDPNPDTLALQLTSLQQHAKDLFSRRQRLKDSASIVTGILDA